MNNSSNEIRISLVIRVYEGHLIRVSSFHGLTYKRYCEIVNEYKSEFMAGKYKSFDHIINPSISGDPDMIIVELSQMGQEK